MFPQHDDLALFSGTPQTVFDDAYQPTVVTPAPTAPTFTDWLEDAGIAEDRRRKRAALDDDWEPPA
jgi:ethanolamine ammonia-lyase large subunit